MADPATKNVIHAPLCFLAYIVPWEMEAFAELLQ